MEEKGRVRGNYKMEDNEAIRKITEIQGEVVVYRIALPCEWVKELGLDKDDREVKLTKESNKIIIEKQV